MRHSCLCCELDYIPEMPLPDAVGVYHETTASTMEKRVTQLYHPGIGEYRSATTVA